MSVRDSFVEHFGEDNALVLEAAATEHENGLHPNKGSEPFRWVLMLTISFECFTKPSYADYHGITADGQEIKAWAIEHGGMADYDGDVDALAAFTGTYDEYAGLA